MHAVLVRVTIHDFEGGQKTLQDEIVPSVSQIPGFVTGHWTVSEDKTNGASMVIFESEGAARGMADRLQSGGVPDEAVSLDSVEVREVVASA